MDSFRYTNTGFWALSSHTNAWVTWHGMYFVFQMVLPCSLLLIRQILGTLFHDGFLYGYKHWILGLSSHTNTWVTWHSIYFVFQILLPCGLLLSTLFPVYWYMRRGGMRTAFCAMFARSWLWHLVIRDMSVRESQSFQWNKLITTHALKQSLQSTCHRIVWLLSIGSPNLKYMY